MPRTIAWLQFGGSGGPVANRTIAAPELQPGGEGWKGYVHRYVLPMLESKRWDALALWMPQGTLPGETLQADSFLLAKEAGLTHLCDGFVEAWAPITRRIEVVAYNGALALTQRLQAVNYTTWIKRVAASYAPFKQAGMSIAFDASSMDAAASPFAEQRRTVGYVKATSASRTRCYVEPWWGKDATWCHRMPCFLTQQFYENEFSGGRFPVWALPSQPAEVIRIVNVTPEGESWATGPRWMQGCVDAIRADGHSVAVGPDAGEWFK